MSPRSHNVEFHGHAGVGCSPTNLLVKIGRLSLRERPRLDFFGIYRDALGNIFHEQESRGLEIGDLSVCIKRSLGCAIIRSM